MRVAPIEFSASRLSAMAEILGVPISYFFGDLRQDNAEISAEDQRWREYLQRPETIEFIRLYYAIQDPRTRQKFLEMTKTLAEAGSTLTEAGSASDPREE